MRHRHRRRGASLLRPYVHMWKTRATHMSPLFVGLMAFLLYLRTLAPDVFVSDFAEFQYQPALLGLPHPNGFPLYMLMGWLWSHLPWGSVAWRMNLLSAFWGSVAVGVTGAFAYRLSGRARVGILAGSLLAITPTFWGYSLLAERYTLNTALLAAALWSTWEASQTQEPQQRKRLLLAASLLLGLGLTVHPSDALLIPFWFAYALWAIPPLRWNWKTWAHMAVAGAAPLVLFLYVPWRWAAFADMPLLPGVMRSEAVYRGLVHVWYEPPLRWDLVRHYIAGLGGYATGLVLGGWDDAIARMGDVWPYWKGEIPRPVAFLALLGGLRLVRREWRLTLVLTAFGVYLTLMVAYIQQGKNDAYLLPAFWVVLFASGFALDWVLRRPVLRPINWMWGGLLLSLPLVLLITRYPDRDLSRRVDVRLWWESTLQVPLEQGAALLGHWSDFTPLWYLQHIDGYRPDLLALFPPDTENVIRPWLATGRPLYQAAPTHGWAPDLPRMYNLIPWGRLARIVPQGVQVPCPEPAKAQRGVAPALSVALLRVPTTLKPGEIHTLQFCWQANRPLPHATFVGVRFTPVTGGTGFEQNERLVPAWYPFDPVPQGTKGLGMVALQVPQGTRAGRYRAVLTFFTLPADGVPTPLREAPTVPLGEVNVLPTRHLQRALLPRETVPLIPPRAGPLRLRAWYLSALPVRPGDPVRLELVWEVVEEPPPDMSVRVRFWGRGGRGLLTPPQSLHLAASDVGHIVRTVHDLRAPRGLGDRIYIAEVRVLAGKTQLVWVPTWRWVVGYLRVRDRPHLWTPPDNVVPVTGTWKGVGELIGYRLEGNVAPGSTVNLTLWWRALNEMDVSYKVFVHLTDASGRIVAQHDSVPALGKLPTDVWVPGEYIEDPHPIALPTTLPAGNYTLRVGLYNPKTGERVEIVSPLQVEDRALLLMQIP